MLICDTSGLLAYFNADEPEHARVVATVGSEAGPLVVSPYVVAELDYLLATRYGLGVELQVLADLAGGAWELPAFAAADLRAAQTVIGRYPDQELGVTDASLVVLAERYRTDRILTLDHRHFRVLRTPSGAAFSLLPD